MASSQSEKNRLPHLMKKGEHTRLIVDGQPFIMLAGELHNSSASSLDYMKPVWPRLKAMNLNTVLATVSWELLEPEEGKFDYTLVDGLIEGARQHDLKLVLIWFGTWKNAFSTYVPAWVKRDTKRFPRMQVKAGDDTGAISALSDEAMKADTRAFTAMMRRIKQVDKDNTVLMVQVQNEAGLLGGDRDRSPLAEAEFAKPVPQVLLDYLRTHEANLLPETKQALQWGKQNGTWEEMFGKDAPEIFMAWHIGKYCNSQAEAGKREHNVPMFANAWLVQHEGQPAGRYPSGGPVSRMLDIWRAAAPSIDFIAPDIYLRSIKEICASYSRSGNPLFIPEINPRMNPAHYAFYPIGQHGALGFSPFAIDGKAIDTESVTETYGFLRSLMPVLLPHYGTDRMAGILQGDGEERQEFELGNYKVIANFEKRENGDRPPGRGIMIATGPGEYLVAGAGFWLRFQPRPGDKPRTGLISVEEGQYENGTWIPGRRLNGDETHPGARLNNELGVLHVKVYSY